jgi:hypothetical protein
MVPLLHKRSAERTSRDRAARVFELVFASLAALSALAAPSRPRLWLTTV